MQEGDREKMNYLLKWQWSGQQNSYNQKKTNKIEKFEVYIYLMWATNVRFCKNSFPHTVHECGTRPWIRPWLTNWNLRGNVAPQSAQTNGLSEPWKRECIIRWFSCAKLSPHSSQTYGRSPAWNLLCVTKWRFNGNERPHSWQMNGLSRLYSCKTAAAERIEKMGTKITLIIFRILFDVHIESNEYRVK